MTDPSPSADHQALLARIHSQLETAGLTPNARDWLIKALHPAALHKCPGIPDHSQAQTVRPDFRTTHVVSAPALIAGPWDLCVVQTPGDALSVFWASGPAGCDFTAYTAPADSEGAAILAQPGEWLGSLQLRGIVDGLPHAYEQQGLESAPWEWRRTYGGVTAYMTASALVDQGTVYAASFPSSYTESVEIISDTYTTPTGRPFLYKTVRTNVPLDENAMQLVAPKIFIAPARHGAYVPQRWIGMDPDFIRPTMLQSPALYDPVDNAWVGIGRVPLAGWSEGSIPIMPRVTSNYQTNPLGSYYASSWVVAISSANAGQRLPPTTAPILDTGMSRHSTGVIIFRGLAHEASVTIRAYMGLEIVPRADSTQRQFAVPPGPGSDEALALYTKIAATIDPAMPASYNALQSLLPVILSALSTAGPPLIRAFMGASRRSRGSVGASLAEVQRVSLSDPRAPAMSEMAVVRPGRRRRRGPRGRGNPPPQTRRSRSRSRSQSRAQTPRRARLALTVRPR
jgi:hypothetical protein